MSLGFSVGALILLTAGEKGDVPLLGIVYLALGGVLLALSLGPALGGLLVPTIELLEPGGKTRWMRWRAVVIASLLIPIPSVAVALLIEQL
jgi:MFS family permease